MACVATVTEVGLPQSPGRAGSGLTGPTASAGGLADLTLNNRPNSLVCQTRGLGLGSQRALGPPLRTHSLGGLWMFLGQVSCPVLKRGEDDAESIVSLLD